MEFGGFHETAGERALNATVPFFVSSRNSSKRGTSFSPDHFLLLGDVALATESCSSSSWCGARCGWQQQRQQQQVNLGVFLHTMRCGEYSMSTKGNAKLVAGTCQAVLTGVCAAFLTEGRPNPSLDADGKTLVLLRHQMQYTNLDPSKGQQKVIDDVTPKQGTRVYCLSRAYHPGVLLCHAELQISETPGEHSACKTWLFVLKTG
jgi:hypothetical protein